MGTIIPYMGIVAKSNTSLADALFTQVQQRVLGVLYGNPGRSFYANEIIRLAGMGTGAVHRELGRLASAGLTTTTRRGNQKHYQANPESPVFEELRSLILKTVGLVMPVRDALMPLANAIDAAFIYGSVAKGEDTASSDIDLMVFSDSLTYADVFGELEPAVNLLGRAVNPTVYSREEVQSRLARDNAFMLRVLEQPKLWVIGSENDLAA